MANNIAVASNAVRMLRRLLHKVSLAGTAPQSDLPPSMKFIDRCVLHGLHDAHNRLYQLLDTGLKLCPIVLPSEAASPVAT